MSIDGAIRWLRPRGLRTRRSVTLRVQRDPLHLRSTPHAASRTGRRRRLGDVAHAARARRKLTLRGSTWLVWVALQMVAPDSAWAAPERDDLDTAYLAYRKQVERGAYDAAYPHAQRALEIGRALYGSSHETTAILQLNVGDLDMLRARYESARPHYERALASLEKLKGESHISLLIPLSDLARIHAQGGYFEQARQLHERALRIVESTYGSKHPAVANRLVTLGIFEELIQDDAAARSRYERSLAIRREVFPEAHPDIAESLFFLAKLELEASHFERAQSLYREAVAIWSRTPPRDTKIVTAARSQLRYAQAKLGSAVPAAAAPLPASTHVQSEAQPLLRAAPEYPERALKRGIEGFVRMAFTVTAHGSVRDVRVIEAEPSRVFDQAAMKALSQWQYKPRIENGNPVEQRDLEIVLRFVLPKD